MVTVFGGYVASRWNKKFDAQAALNMAFVNGQAALVERLQAYAKDLRDERDALIARISNVEDATRKCEADRRDIQRQLDECHRNCEQFERYIEEQERRIRTLEGYPPT